MRHVLFTLLIATIFSTFAHADHSDREKRDIKKYSYELADLSEELEHRAYDYGVRRAADRLHREASRLYHLARREYLRNSFETSDHSEERIERAYRYVEQAYHRLRSVARNDDSRYLMLRIKITFYKLSRIID